MRRSHTPTLMYVCVSWGRHRGWEGKRPCVAARGHSRPKGQADPSVSLRMNWEALWQVMET